MNTVMAEVLIVDGSEGSMPQSEVRIMLMKGGSVASHAQTAILASHSTTLAPLLTGTYRAELYRNDIRIGTSPDTDLSFGNENVFVITVEDGLQK